MTEAPAPLVEGGFLLLWKERVAAQVLKSLLPALSTLPSFAGCLAAVATVTHPHPSYPRSC